jgi:hypothetical protein
MAQLETYVTIHDQALLLECERTEQYAQLGSYTYLFVGPRPVDQVPPDVKIIVARDFTPNYEHLPAFYDFTGWWVLAHHGLITAEHAMLIQYDMHIASSFIEEQVSYQLEIAPGVVAFTAGHNLANNFMLLIPGFQETYRAGVAQLGIDPAGWPEFNEWPTTQGTGWRTEDFNHFMNWFTPLFDAWVNDLWAGHLAERTVKAWSVTTGNVERYLPGVIVHHNQDTHGTCALMAGNVALHQERAATFGR